MTTQEPENLKETADEALPQSSAEAAENVKDTKPARKARRPKAPRAPNAPSRGPGRPPKGPVPYRINLQVRVTEETAEAAHRLGGADFLRPLIENAISLHEASNKADAASRLAVRKPAAGDPPVKFVDMLAVCGFPSPALDYAAQELSLNDYFVRHQDATYIVEAQGDSMIDAGIREGDILIIDRSVEPRSGDIVLAYLHGDFTLKRLRIVDGVPELHPENQAGTYPVIHPSEYDDFQIEGVLVGSGRRYRK